MVGGHEDMCRMQAWCFCCRALWIKLIIIDSWSGSLGALDENSAKDCRPAMQRLNIVAKTFGIPILVLAHGTKESGKGRLPGTT
jgi:hypothetical protein